MREMALKSHLRAILGEEGFVQFCQAFGGTRVYVPHGPGDDSEIVAAIGRERADKLSRAFAPDTIRVPLAKRERGLFYRTQGLSNAKIALKLGMTEPSVNRMFAAEDNLPDKPRESKNGAQLKLI